MDLSFARFHAGQAATLPVELAVLLVGVASRQAASATARAAAMMTVRMPCETLLAPAAGSFSAATAAALRCWQEG